MPIDDAPPQPRAILRGHSAPVHAATFVRSNERLLTGDADGFVVAWDLSILRPRAVWRAHDNAILGMSEWAPDKVITHGRDNRLIVWKLSAEDEQAMSSTLPLDPAPEPRTKPWMVHLLQVNTMNFCSFSATSASAPPPDSAPLAGASELLIAVPNTLDSEAVDIYHLPTQSRIHTVKLGGDSGMAMDIALVWVVGALTLVVGYENGSAVVAQLDHDGSWNVIYRNRAHKQPVLSLDVPPTMDYFLTSGADAIVAKHPLLSRQSPDPETTENLDENVVAGYKEQSTSDHFDPGYFPDRPTKSVSALSAALADMSTAGRLKDQQTRRQLQTQPIKVINTKHSGQQGLKIRSDGRVFATAGWDSKIRVYSAKTLHEVAVLKWHPVGCFAVAFAQFPVSGSDQNKSEEPASHVDGNADKSLAPRMLNTSVKLKRMDHAKNAHWLAAGSKDGKVSLWEVF